MNMKRSERGCEKRQAHFGQLIRDGYCLIENVLEDDMLDRLHKVSNGLLDNQSEAARAEQTSTGSMISVQADPFFAELVSYPRALETLSALGVLRPRWCGGYVISKPPQSAPLFWHQDWWGWNDASSYRPLPQQIFLMYYLVDTAPHNGCLRVVPGTHLKRHLLHDEMPIAHAEQLRRVTDPDHLAYQFVPEEVDVPVQAGDLVIGDSRLLHSAHANKSHERRTVITLWYAPYFDLLPDRIRAAIARIPLAEGWPDQAREKIAELIPTYQGEAEPIELNRVPGKDLTF
jgi:hypothetical protein